MMTYVGTVYPLPTNVKGTITKLLIKFIVPFFSEKNHSVEEIERKIFSFAAPISLDGMGIDHITLHTDLFLLKDVMKYVKCKVENTPLNNNLYFVEYNIGFQLCNYLKIPVNNSTGHTQTPNFVYNYIFQLIKQFRISKTELSEGSVNAIYKRIIFEKNQMYKSINFHRIWAKFLPSYLQTFNYKLRKHLLPVQTMFREYALDNESVCYFCHIGPESIYHIFGTCEKLKILWQIMSEVHFRITNGSCNYEHLRKNLKLDTTKMNLQKNFEKVLIYFNSVVNYSIWKMRNDIKFKFENFKIKVLVKKIIRSIGARKATEPKLADSFKIPLLKELHDTLISVCSMFPFDNG